MRDDNRDKDNAVRKILGYDPGLLKTGLAIMEMDEKGNLVIDSLKVYQANNVKSSPFGFLAEAMGVRPAVDMEGPVRTPSWLLPNMFPPELPDGWFFWDIPTTLMVTDPRVKMKIQYLFAREQAKIPHNKTGLEWMTNHPDADRYADFCKKGLSFLNADFENDWWE